MNSTAIDDHHRGFEDFVALPDLAAGMLSEIASGFINHPVASEHYICSSVNVSDKAQVIADWFWWPHANLKRTCILIDTAGPQQFKVTRITMKDA
jgi:hypothetical protein